jgi:hypothetical protein
MRRLFLSMKLTMERPGQVRCGCRRESQPRVEPAVRPVLARRGSRETLSHGGGAGLACDATGVVLRSGFGAVARVLGDVSQRVAIGQRHRLDLFVSAEPRLTHAMRGGGRRQHTKRFFFAHGLWHGLWTGGGVHG